MQQPGLLAKLFKHKSKPLKGLYFMGGTGRGKTYLLDCFYECLPFREKHRVHFHRFMLEIHDWLKQLPPSPDPLEVIGAALAQETAPSVFYCVLYVWMNFMCTTLVMP